MILYQDNTPIPVTVKSPSSFGFVRLYHSFSGKYIATLPARFVRQKVGSITYNDHVYRWMDYNGSVIEKDGTIYIIGPHHYAFYLCPKNTWKESATFTNEQLKIQAREDRKNRK
jgi:hypothetical protein